MEGPVEEPRRPGDLHRRLRRRQSGARDQQHDAATSRRRGPRQSGHRLLRAGGRRAPDRSASTEDIILSFITKGERTTPAQEQPRQAELSGRVVARRIEAGVHDEPRRQPRDLRDEQGRDRSPPGHQQPGDRRCRRRGRRPARQIAWVSDRTGTPQIYIMNADGTGRQHAGRRSVVGPSDVVARQVQRDRVCDAQRPRLRHQDLQLRDRRGDERSPTASAATRARRSRPTGATSRSPRRATARAQLFTVDRDGKQPAPDHPRGQ